MRAVLQRVHSRWPGEEFCFLSLGEGCYPSFPGAAGP